MEGRLKVLNASVAAKIIQNASANMLRKKRFRWTSKEEGVPFPNTNGIPNTSADAKDEAEGPIPPPAEQTQIIKEIMSYPKELVIYFNDGSTRVYVEKVSE